jgi:hypothetical protein
MQNRKLIARTGHNSIGAPPIVAEFHRQTVVAELFDDRADLAARKGSFRAVYQQGYDIKNVQSVVHVRFQSHHPAGYKSRPVVAHTNNPDRSHHGAPSVSRGRYIDLPAASELVRSKHGCLIVDRSVRKQFLQPSRVVLFKPQRIAEYTRAREDARG